MVTNGVTVNVYLVSIVHSTTVLISGQRPDTDTVRTILQDLSYIRNSKQYFPFHLMGIGCMHCLNGALTICCNCRNKGRYQQSTFYQIFRIQEN